MKFSHLDEKGNAKMVDISTKEISIRRAVATGKIFINKDVLKEIINGKMPKGDVISTSRIAGILAAKRTQDLIPMCHSIPLDCVELVFNIDLEQNFILIEAMTICTHKTGVEMEALTAVTVAALTIYDMCKAVDKNMEIGEIKLIKKTGGKSDYFRRAE